MEFDMRVCFFFGGDMLNVYKLLDYTSFRDIDLILKMNRYAYKNENSRSDTYILYVVRKPDKL